MKSQYIRLADVFLIGPLMIWSGYKLKKDYPIAGNTLYYLGLATIGYNGVNYLISKNK